MTSPSHEEDGASRGDRTMVIDWIDFIRETLRIKTQVHESIGFTQSVAHFVLRHGQPFDEMAPPTSVPTWAQVPHGCFANCLRLADFSRSLTYVEGFAVIAGCRYEIDHAWCVDDLGRVLDPTWKQPGDGYFGVPFATSYVRRRLRAQLRTGWVDALLTAGDDNYRLVQGVETARWKGTVTRSGTPREKRPRKKSSAPG